VARVANIWNSLPIDIVTASSLNSFKIDLISIGCNRILNIIVNRNYEELDAKVILMFVN